jgi:hypothetical protein
MNSTLVDYELEDIVDDEPKPVKKKGKNTKNVAEKRKKACENLAIAMHN